MVALSTYVAETRRLLQNPPAPTSLYATADLETYVNTARGQVAADGECVRAQGTLALTLGTRIYDFSSVNTGTSSVTGVGGLFTIRQALVVIGDGQKWITPRPFEWFTYYRLNDATPTQARPTEWAQYKQGELGSIYVDPVPDDSYTLNVDCLAVPNDLAADGDVDAIPYPWTDAVPYFAAYLALLAAQSAQRQADAARMLERYNEFKDRARRYSNSTVLPYSHPQVQDPTMINQLGLSQRQG